MRLVITEKQLRDIVKRRFPNQEIGEEEDVAAAAPEAGTSSDGDTKTGMSKWESGVTRGPANQIAVTRWKDIAGVTPARGKANPLWEQNLLTPTGLASATLKTVIDLDPRLDTPFKEETTFWGDIFKIPTDGSVHYGKWEGPPRAAKFKDAKESEGYWFWKQKYYDPETKQATEKWELAPDESSLKEMFPDNTLRGIYVVKEDKFFATMLYRTNDEWKPYNGYFYSPGNGQKAIAYKPELYIHTSTTTSIINWVSENKWLIAEVIASIVAGILTGGASLMVQALVQAGVSIAFASTVYALSDKQSEDKRGLAIGLALSALPFIPAAINKFGLKGPLKGLAAYGDDLARATDEESVARIIANFPEAEQLIIKTAFKEIPKHEFEKVIANKAARGFAAQVRAGKIDLGKLPAHKLKWWHELLIEGGGAIPVSIGVGYVYKTIEERKEAERRTKVLAGDLDSKENLDAIEKEKAKKIEADKIAAERGKSNQNVVQPIKKPTINNNIKKPVNNQPVPFDDFKRGPSQPDSTSITK